VTDGPSGPSDDEPADPLDDPPGGRPPPPSPDEGTFGPVPPVQEPTNGTTPGWLVIRLYAKLLDGLVIAILTGLLFATTDIDVASRFAAVVQAGAFFLYLVLLESSSGVTLGKRLLKLTVVGEDGGIPSLPAAAKRNAYALLQALPPLLGSLVVVGAWLGIAASISRDPEYRGVHDRLAGTRVQRVLR
jgi:uncharacterized RDD family membrane protein YckC